jgi:deoxyribodipyrimidine photo-lyase
MAKRAASGVYKVPYGLPKLPAVEGFALERARLITQTTDFPTAASLASSASASASTAAHPPCVVYWMSRDQRAEDNWAALYARGLARHLGVPLVVVFSLVPRFLEATIRHFGFMLRGLAETAEALQAKRVPFHLLRGYATETVPAFVRAHNVLGVVCDMSPLRGPLEWVSSVGAKLDALHVPLVQVCMDVYLSL